MPDALQRRLLPSLAAVILCAVVAPAAWAKEHKVSIKDVSFSPRELKVRKGDTVVWTNGDERDHTVTADDGSFKSGNVADGKSFRQKFDKPGKYKYHCDYHPRMKATIVVEE
jgi:plastocyanin